MAVSLLQFVSLSLVIGLAWTNNPDEVTSLPGVNFSLPFKHYAGYLEALDGNQLFYWFFESQRNPSKDPVMLWLNGGPCCSSLFGALTENGPLRVVSNQSLELNRFAWNIRANVLYLESPAEVGFSYNPRHDRTTDDNITAENNLAALRSFFQKFPHLKENEFYITGESYAGIYIPTLSMLALQADFMGNFRGFAIGNGLLDSDLNSNSLYPFFAHHGFLDDDQWQTVLNGCCANVTKLRHCKFVHNNNEHCSNATSNAMHVIWSAHVHGYNIYNIPRDQQLLTISQKEELFLGQNRTKNVLRSIFDNNLESYLNRQDVRKALHIRPESTSNWSNCIGMNNYKKLYNSMKKQVKHLFQSGLKGLIYNGDFDSACNFIGDLWFSEELGFRTIQSYKPWMVNETHDLGGFVKQFEHFYFATVYGAGHMVPTDKPAAAQTMIYKFLIDA